MGTPSISRMRLYQNSIGAVRVKKKVWTDPDFDPSLNSFYYARVIQWAQPRWTTYDAKKLGVAPRNDVPSTVPRACLDVADLVLRRQRKHARRLRPASRLRISSRRVPTHSMTPS